MRHIIRESFLLQGEQGQAAVLVQIGLLTGVIGVALGDLDDLDVIGEAGVGELDDAVLAAGHGGAGLVVAHVGDDALHGIVVLVHEDQHVVAHAVGGLAVLRPFVGGRGPLVGGGLNAVGVCPAFQLGLVQEGVHILFIGEGDHYGVILLAVQGHIAVGVPGGLHGVHGLGLVDVDVAVQASSGGNGVIVRDVADKCALRVAVLAEGGRDGEAILRHDEVLRRTEVVRQHALGVVKDDLPGVLVGHGDGGLVGVGDTVVPPVDNSYQNPNEHMHFFKKAIKIGENIYVHDGWSKSESSGNGADPEGVNTPKANLEVPTSGDSAVYYNRYVPGCRVKIQMTSKDGKQVTGIFGIVKPDENGNKVKISDLMEKDEEFKKAFEALVEKAKKENKKVVDTLNNNEEVTEDTEISANDMNLEIGGNQ